jgi:hypothetical protein
MKPIQTFLSQLRAPQKPLPPPPGKRAPIPLPNTSKCRFYLLKSKNDSILYYGTKEKNSQSVSLEEAFKIINEELKAFETINWLKNPEQRNQLAELRKFERQLTKDYKENHEGFFGRIHLAIRGILHGGHINDVSKDLDATLSTLLSKRNAPISTNFDNFLDLAAPLSIELPGATMRVQNPGWHYDKETNLIFEQGFSLQREDYISDLPLILAKLDEQLSGFGHLQETSIKQKEQLASLENKVINRIAKSSDYDQHDAVKENILAKIDHLRNLPTPQTPAEKMAEMHQKSTHISQELLSSERNFHTSADNSIKALTRLMALKDNKKVKCGKQFEAFFHGIPKGKEKKENEALLTECLNAFQNLDALSVALADKINEAARQPNITARNNALYEIYSSNTYQDYCNALATTARYYPY